MHRIHRRLTYGLCALGSVTLLTLNAHAQLLPTDWSEYWSEHWGDQPFWPELSGIHDASYDRYGDLLSDAIKDEFGEISDAVQAIVEASFGALDIPDMTTVEDLLMGLIDQLNEDEYRLDVPPAVIQVEAVQQQINRDALKSRANTVLGADGQQVIELKLDQLQQDMVAVHDLSVQAQGQIATQDVAKDLTQQMAINTQVTGAVYTELIDTRIDTQLNAQVLADVAADLAADRKRQVEAELGTSVAIFSAAAQVMLSVTPDSNRQVEWSGGQP